MIYPDVLTYKQLNSRAADYSEREKFHFDVDTLYKGGRHMEARKSDFLNKRLDEDAEIYKIRLDRFVYTNIFASVLTRILSRFSTGEIFLSGISDSYSEAWAKFRESTDGQGCDEHELIAALLKHLLLYQECHVQIDKPLSDAQPLNRAQEQAMGLDSAVAIIYSPYELLARGDDWYKFLVIEEVSQPFGDSVHRATWRFVDADAIAEYQEIVELKDGKIVALLTTGKRVPVADALSIPIASYRLHGFTDIPVVSRALPDEKYAAGQIYLKLKQHLAVENALTDTAVSAGYVQRVFKPLQSKDDHYNVVDESELKSDNAHLLKAESFKFEEISGSSIQTNSDLLEKIEGQVERLLCITGGAVSQGALVQSGASKAMDQDDLKTLMIAYGRLVSAFYQDIMQRVGEAIGDSQAEVQIAGLDSFDLGSLGDDIEQAIALIPIQEKVAPTALRNLYVRISQQLSSNGTAAELELIESQIPENFNQNVLPVGEQSPGQ